MGGIEKFNRAFMKALLQLSFVKPFFAGLHDQKTDERYVPQQLFQPYHGKQLLFVLQNILRSFQQDELILGHINLAIIGVVFKFFKPSKKSKPLITGISISKKIKSTLWMVIQPFASIALEKSPIKCKFG